MAMIGWIWALDRYEYHSTTLGHPRTCFGCSLWSIIFPVACRANQGTVRELEESFGVLLCERARSLDQSNTLRVPGTCLRDPADLNSYGLILCPRHERSHKCLPGRREHCIRVAV